VEEGAEGRREAAGSGASRDQGASFGVRLRRLREAAGFSQEELAARAEERLAYSLGDLADVHCSTGDLENGADYYKRSLALHRDLDDRRSIALTLHNLGEIALKQGDPMKAEDLFEGSLRMAREIDDRWLIINMLPGMGSLLGLLGHGERAVGVLAAADALRREIGFEFQSHSLADYERAVEQARKALPAERFEAVWQGGCAMSLEEVARYVLRGDAVP
jgi:tetratricopeptide (TPR) repeat protein